MKTKHCEIVKDLLPLYVEDLLSAESRALVGEHLLECEDCRDYLEKCRMEVDVPVQTPGKVDKKIKRGMRSRILWYMFWPSLYAACLQFNKEGTLRLFVIALVICLFSTVYSHVAMYSFDTDDTKKEFYRRERENMRQGRGSFLTQGLMICLPIFIPVVIGMAGLYFN